MNCVFSPLHLRYICLKDFGKFYLTLEMKTYFVWWTEWRRLVLAGRASSTVAAYLRSLKRWKSFTEKHTGISYFPAESSHVALYLQHVLDTTCSYHTVDAAFYSIKWAHNIAGIPSPTDHSVVNFVREGAKRILGTATTNRKNLWQQSS